MFRSFDNFWHSYQHYIEKAMQPQAGQPLEDIVYWQQRLFINAIIYALPASLLALVPSVILEYRNGHLFMAYFNVTSITAVMAVAFAGKFSMELRKVVVSVIIALFAIILPIFIGGFSMGCIYLFSLSVFVCLQFSDRAAYTIVGFNLLVCLGFAFIIYYKLFNIPLVHDMPFGKWAIYSVNFLFMDLVAVILIRQILNGLTDTMQKQKWLFNQLQKETVEKASLHKLIENSEEYYRALFFHSPSPKLIFDIKTLKFIQVNMAAIRAYGYSENEFLNMKLTDIHSDEQIAGLLHRVYDADQTDDLVPYVTQHNRKDGKKLHVEIRRSNITYKGKQARMIIATDITQNIEHTAAIQKQNDKLREIAHLQSHVIRLPLARIMSISELIKLEYKEAVNSQLLDYLDISVNELDGVIHKIVNQSAEITGGKR